MRVTGQYALNHGVEAKPGHEIDPEKEYWYRQSDGTLHELPNRRQRLWNAMPWVQRANRRRWEQELRKRSDILRWELDHLPDAVWTQTAEPLKGNLGQSVEIVTGGHLMSDDALTVEMAADTICAILAGYPNAEEAFRTWFVTRYPLYE